MDEVLKSYLDAKFAEVHKKIEATETKLLSEFWKCGRATDQRMHRIEQSDADVVDKS